MADREQVPDTQQDPTKFQPRRRDGDEDDTLDEALEESFPASDPPSVTRPDEHAPATPRRNDP